MGEWGGTERVEEAAGGGRYGVIWYMLDPIPYISFFYTFCVSKCDHVHEKIATPIGISS